MIPKSCCWLQELVVEANAYKINVNYLFEFRFRDTVGLKCFIGGDGQPLEGIVGSLSAEQFLEKAKETIQV